MTRVEETLAELVRIDSVSSRTNEGITRYPESLEREVIINHA